MESDSKRDLEELLASYVDRLNEGEGLDPDKILAENPLVGAEILEYLEDYVAVASNGDDNEPLGILGDYTLRRQIGRGGMGVVYEAWQNSMDRQVALKVLPVGIAAGSKACTRFTTANGGSIVSAAKPPRGFSVAGPKGTKPSHALTI